MSETKAAYTVDSPAGGETTAARQEAGVNQRYPAIIEEIAKRAMAYRGAGAVTIDQVYSAYGQAFMDYAEDQRKNPKPDLTAEVARLKVNMNALLNATDALRRSLSMAPNGSELAEMARQFVGEEAKQARALLGEYGIAVDAWGIAATEKGGGE